MEDIGGVVEGTGFLNHFIREIRSRVDRLWEKFSNGRVQGTGATAKIEKPDGLVAQLREQPGQGLYFRGGKIVGVESCDFQGFIQQGFIVVGKFIEKLRHDRYSSKGMIKFHILIHYLAPGKFIPNLLLNLEAHFFSFGSISKLFQFLRQSVGFAGN